MNRFNLKQNDTQPSILATLMNGDGEVLNVTGAAVRFILRSYAGTLVSSNSCVVVSGPQGLVRYDWRAADTETAGLFEAEFEVTYQDGLIETFPNDSYITIEITPELA